MSNFSDKFMEVAGKVGSQRHLVAVRDSFVAIMPVTMAGSIAVLLNVFIRDIPNNLGWTGFVETMDPLIEINTYVNFGSIGIMALVFAFSFGYHLAKMHGVSKLTGGLVSFGAFLATLPQTVKIATVLDPSDVSSFENLKTVGLTLLTNNGTDSLEVVGKGLSLTYIGATGLFAALITGFLSMYVFAVLTKRDVIIKLPDSVPPAVNKAFAGIIPGLAAIYSTAIVAVVILRLTGLPLSDLVSSYIQKPLLGMSQGLGMVVIIPFIIQLLWFFGVHGNNVMSPVMQSVLGVALTENTAVYEATKNISELPYKWNLGSFNSYSQLGGAGGTLALIIAIFIFSKREEHRTIARLSAPMGVFNINEPLIFGIPIILNPTFAIPWLFASPICSALGYFATISGLVPPAFIKVPWITPPIIQAYLSAGGSFRAAIASVIILAISVLIWMPFVIASNKIKVDD